MAFLAEGGTWDNLFFFQKRRALPHGKKLLQKRPDYWCLIQIECAAFTFNDLHGSMTAKINSVKITRLPRYNKK
jgi:hypothetical protein